MAIDVTVEAQVIALFRRTLDRFGIAASCLHPGNTLVERRVSSGQTQEAEPMIAVKDIARTALLMATLPPEANMLEAIVLPVTQKYIGRG